MWAGQLFAIKSFIIKDQQCSTSLVLIITNINRNLNIPIPIDWCAQSWGTCPVAQAGVDVPSPGTMKSVRAAQTLRTVLESTRTKLKLRLCHLLVTEPVIISFIPSLKWEKDRYIIVIFKCDNAYKSTVDLRFQSPLSIAGNVHFLKYYVTLF